ncbi:MAG: D-arabinose 5-phosphate isomerase [Coxiella sp. RIFCSPHIGHO2_12_FULL_44_14]|nr:MAG: D-arabinose 5-phosphate isomerase [Coxiella sp. RIFCSPHIGHO2_12_FULL_44_14]
MMSTDEALCQLGKAVIATEMRAVQALQARIDQNFAKACRLLLHCQGRIVVFGLGKSGHIAKKIAATLASTGSPAFYVHPSEASHGDLGMLRSDDVSIAISYSGETVEIINVIPTLKRLSIPLIAITGKLQSFLAKTASVCLDVSVEQEACPLGLAPTASTTATLVMGDALAVALLDARGFTADDFAKIHPGGTLGKRLLLHVDQLMHKHPDMPLTHLECRLSEALVEITRKSLGMIAIVEPSSGKLAGVFTDGDLRRTLDKGYDIHSTLIGDVMTRGGITISPQLLAVEALSLMQQHKITALVVTGEDCIPLGVVHMHDLLRAGVV